MSLAQAVGVNRSPGFSGGRFFKLRGVGVRFGLLFIAIWTEVLVANAIGTELFLAASTCLHAALARYFIAMLATDATSGAGTLIAVRAGAGAFGADHLVAAGAYAVVIFVHDAAAIVTTHSLPLLQLDVSSSCRIGVEQPIDHREEVKQPSFGQCFANTDTTIPFAEDFVVHMRMSNQTV